jgi:hypothetical protein
MAEYIVTDPQTGQRVRLVGDSPPTEQELEEIFASISGNVQPYTGPETLLSNSLQDPEIARMTIPERMQRGLYGGDVAGALYGAAKPFIGVAQLGVAAGEKLFGVPEGQVPLSQRISSGLQSFEQKREQAGGGGLPVAAGQMIPVSRAISAIKPASGFIGRALQGLGIGAGAGAVEPVTSPDADFGAAKTAQVGTGATVGLGSSLAGTLLTQGARRFLPSGAEITAGELANELAGSRQPEVMAELTNPQLRYQRVPITAAQAAANANSAEFSALEARMAQQAPSDFNAIAQSQDEARAASMLNIARTPQEIDAAVRARTAATSPLYTAAEASTVPVDAMRSIRLIDRITSARQGRPQVTNVLNGVRNTLLEAYPTQERATDSWNQIRTVVSGYQGNHPEELNVARRILNGVKNFDLDPFTAIARLQALRPQDQAARDAITAAIRNLEIPDMVVTQNAQRLINASRNIGDLLDARDPAGRQINQAVSRELYAIQRSLNNTISRSVPAFGQAEKLFADLSTPIDRMKVGQYLQDRLIPAINEYGAGSPQRATVFANALRDMNESVRGATGFRRATGIADLMTPDEMQAINDIGTGLARDVNVQRMASSGNRAVTEALGEMFSEQSPNTLSKPIMIVNAILRRTGASATERTMRTLAESMQDPVAMADIMQKATDAERRAIERGIMLYLTNGAVSQPDEAAGWAERASREAQRAMGSAMSNVFNDQAGAQ